MNVILGVMAKIAYKYGKEGAGMPSFRGTYEMEVPVELINQNDHMKQNSDYVD